MPRRSWAAAALASALVVALPVAAPAGTPPSGSSVHAKAAAVGSGCAAAERLPSRRLRVGLVMGAGPTDAFNAILYHGLQRAVRELGVEGKALVVTPKADALASLSYLARRGFDLVTTSA